jgi:pimeloyl-ACP methyl ester carboxylesterase
MIGAATSDRSDTERTEQMPSIEHDGATIYYEEYGQGFPIFTFAPGGLMSTIDVWNRPAAPINPIKVFAGDFRVIAMDQRNAGGQSHSPITAQDGWHSFASDHIAVLDHLGIDRCHLFGQCIGGPFILRMLKDQPERIASAVIVQPIGRAGPMPPEPSPNFEAWVKTVQSRPGVNEQVLDAFNGNLYGPGFAYSVDRDFVRSCQTPCLVLAGNDQAHPFVIAEEIAQLLPDAEFIPEWREGAALEAATARMKQFLADHTPVRA